MGIILESPSAQEQSTLAVSGAESLFAFVLKSSIIDSPHLALTRGNLQEIAQFLCSFVLEDTNSCDDPDDTSSWGFGYRLSLLMIALRRMFRERGGYADIYRICDLVNAAGIRRERSRKQRNKTSRLLVKYQIRTSDFEFLDHDLHEVNERGITAIRKILAEAPWIDSINAETC